MYCIAFVSSHMQSACIALMHSKRSELVSWVLLKQYCVMSPHFPDVVPKIGDELSGLTETQKYLDWVIKASCY